MHIIMSITKSIELKIRQEAKRQRLPLLELCEKISMTEPGLYKMFSNGSMKIKNIRENCRYA